MTSPESARFAKRPRISCNLWAGTARALVADLVPPELRGTAYGTYFATLGLIDLPAREPGGETIPIPFCLGSRRWLA